MPIYISSRAVFKKPIDSARSKGEKWHATYNSKFDWDEYQIKMKIRFWILLGAIVLVLGVVVGLVVVTSWQNRVDREFLNTPIPEVKAQEVRLIYGKSSYYDYSLKDAPEYSKTHYTAATRDWPRGTILKVCRINPPGVWDPPCVEVMVNDYGPNKEIHPDRIIDLSSAAFKKLSTLKAGLVNVSIEVL